LVTVVVFIRDARELRALGPAPHSGGQLPHRDRSLFTGFRVVDHRLRYRHIPGSHLPSSAAYVNNSINDCLRPNVIAVVPGVARHPIR